MKAFCWIVASGKVPLADHHKRRGMSSGSNSNLRVLCGKHGN